MVQASLKGNSYDGRTVPWAGSIWDADRLVNIPDVFPSLSKQELKTKIDTIFKTQPGRMTAHGTFLSAG